MNERARELGFFVISVFLVIIPFFTGLRLGRVGEVDFLTLCGLILSLGEVVGLMVAFLCRYE